MFKQLPETTDEVLKWKWENIDSYYQELESRPLSKQNIGEWLKDWSDLMRRVLEMYNRWYVATTTNTADKNAEEGFKVFLALSRMRKQRRAWS